MRKDLKVPVLLLFGLVFVSAALLGCGSDDDSSAVKQTPAPTGKVAVILKDAPADFDNVWIWINKIELLPVGSPDSLQPVVLFEAQHPFGYRVDLLDLKDQDLLLTLNTGVPVGHYQTIRLWLADVKTNGGCSETQLALPSGMIDIEGENDLTVKSGQTLSLQLDIDAEKSISSNGSAHTEPCRFRPIVFLDHRPSEQPIRSQGIIFGTIEQLDSRADDGQVTGFTLALDGGRGHLQVLLDRQTAFVDADGQQIDAQSLSANQLTAVKGALDVGGRLQADAVIIGQVDIIKGTLGASASLPDRFSMRLRRGQELVGDQIEVLLPAGAPVMFADGQPAGTPALSTGVTAQVLGSYLSEDQLFEAVAVIIASETIEGVLTRTTDADDGHLLSIETYDRRQREVFVSADAPVHIAGNGPIELGMVQQLNACRSLQAIVRLAPATDQQGAPAALDVQIVAEKMTVVTDRIEPASQDGTELFGQNGETVFLPAGVEVLSSTANQNKLLSVDRIEDGSKLILYGIGGCQADLYDFYALMGIRRDDLANFEIAPPGWELFGSLMDIGPHSQGNRLTVEDIHGQTHQVLVAADVNVHFHQGPAVNLVLLAALVDCRPRAVLVRVDPQSGSALTATSVSVLMDPLHQPKVAVQRIDAQQRIVYGIDGQRIFVPEGARIVIGNAAGTAPISSDQIELSDKIIFQGLVACENDRQAPEVDGEPDPEFETDIYDTVAFVCQVVEKVVPEPRVHQEIAGTLLKLEPGPNYDILHLQTDHQQIEKVLLSPEIPILFQNGHPIPIDLFSHLAQCQERQLLIELYPGASMERMAREITIYPDPKASIVHTVRSIDVQKRVISTTEGLKNYVPEATDIISHPVSCEEARSAEDSASAPVRVLPLDTLEPGDEFEFSGLAACQDSDYSWYAYTLQIFEPMLNCR